MGNSFVAGSETLIDTRMFATTTTTVMVLFWQLFLEILTLHLADAYDCTYQQYYVQKYNGLCNTDMPNYDRHPKNPKMYNNKKTMYSNNDACIIGYLYLTFTYFQLHGRLRLMCSFSSNAVFAIANSRISVWEMISYLYKYLFGSNRCTGSWNLPS